MMNQHNPSHRVQTHRYLPAQMNTTIGRDADMLQATSLLRNEHIRLLTLTGPGGVGKTRLALEIGRQMRAFFSEEVFFVQLAPLRDHTFVLPTIARSIGIEETGQYSISDELQAYLHNKHMLLIVDNFEHVMAANIAIADLLAAAPDLKILATSREALHIYGEHEFEVLPLALPATNQQQEIELDEPSDAMRLFVERAQAIKPGFTLKQDNIQTIAEICIQLDGLPLAIELAAARCKLLSLQELLERLHSRLRTLVGGARNLSPRQQTLRATLDWSYNLLNEEERYFFRQLGILTGNWTLEAATAIARSEAVFEEDTLILLGSLVDKSLVRVADDTGPETRFSLLETIREYALDCLKQNRELLEAQKRHARFFTALVERCEPYLYGNEQPLWLARLDLEAANIWLALRRVIDQLEVDIAQQLASNLGRFLQLRGSLNESYSWLEEVIAISSSTQPNHFLARIYYSAGTMAHLHGNLALARSRLEECNRIAAQTGDIRTHALAQGALALLDLHRGHYERARQLAEDSLETLRDSSDIWCRGMLYSICGNIASQQSDFTAAQVRYALSLRLLRQAGDIRSQADVLINVGDVMSQRSKLITAVFLYQKGLPLYQQLNDRWGQVVCLSSIGNALRLRGDYEGAQQALNACLGLATALGTRRERANALLGLGKLDISTGSLARASQRLKESLHITREINYPSGIVAVLSSLGDLARLNGQYDDARAHYEESMSMMAGMGNQVSKISIFYGLGCVALAKQDYEQAGIEIRKALHHAFQHGDLLGMAIALEGFAQICQQVDLPERAVQFLGTASILREGVSAPIEKVHQASYTEQIDSYKKNISEKAFSENWSVGRNMSLPQTLGMIANIHLHKKHEAVAEKSRAAYPAGLTTREVDVLRLLAEGLTDVLIAQKLVLSPRTVNTHLRSIYAKLGVTSRTAASRFAFEHKLV
ncbi:LuxR C-terminal-related transcriptional regulator [Dictyobacter halimunensis]